MIMLFIFSLIFIIKLKIVALFKKMRIVTTELYLEMLEVFSREYFSPLSTFAAVAIGIDAGDINEFGPSAG